jgi:hypothetical protein
VMLVRNRDAGGSSHAERTQIKMMQNVCSLFPTEHGPVADCCPIGGGGCCGKPQGQWKVVVALGPACSEQLASDIYSLWMRSPRGVLSKAARGEVLSIMYGVPGYIDWREVLGTRESLAEHCNVVVCDDPCLV